MVHTVRNRVSVWHVLSGLRWSSGLCTGVDGCSLSSQTGLLLSLELGLHGPKRTGGVCSCDQGPSWQKSYCVPRVSVFLSLFRHHHGILSVLPCGCGQSSQAIHCLCQAAWGGSSSSPWPMRRTGNAKVRRVTPSPKGPVPRGRWSLVAVTDTGQTQLRGGAVWQEEQEQLGPFQLGHTGIESGVQPAFSAHRTLMPTFRWVFPHLLTQPRDFPHRLLG